MKTTFNAPKTRLNQLKKVITRNSAVFACLIFIGGSLNAQDFWNQFQSDSKNDQWITSTVERPFETAKTNSSIQKFEADPILDIDVLVNNNEYHAEAFVAAEMAGEAENLKNSNDETNTEIIEAETAFQIDLLMNNCKYEAKKYVESEMAVEVEPLNPDDNFIQKAETATASECNQHIERYARNQMLLHENRISKQIAEAQTGN